MTKRIKVTVETERIFIFRRVDAAQNGSCIEINAEGKMKTRNTLVKVFGLFVVAAGLGLVIVAWQARDVQAIQDSEDFPSPVVFDVAAGQTARLSVVNSRFSRPPDGDQPEQPTLDGSPKRVRLSFDVYAPDGDATSCVSRYRFLRREFCDVLLKSGEAVSYDYSSTENVKISASIQSLGGLDTRLQDAQLTPEPHLTPTLELREGARTLFVLPVVAKGFNPQPDPASQP